MLPPFKGSMPKREGEGELTKIDKPSFAYPMLAFKGKRAMRPAQKKCTETPSQMFRCDIHAGKLNKR